MANYIISYDLNGPNPSHKQMDDHLARAGANRARVLETVWWVDYSGSAAQLRDYLRTILRAEDSLLVCAVSAAAWQNLLVADQSFKTAFERGECDQLTRPTRRLVLICHRKPALGQALQSLHEPAANTWRFGERKAWQKAVERGPGA